MWCANCQADVAAEVLDDNRSVRCANCQSSLGALRGADSTERTRQARELLERWAHSGIVDPSTVRSSTPPQAGESDANSLSPPEPTLQPEPVSPTVAATQTAAEPAASRGPAAEGTPSSPAEEPPGTPFPHDDEPAVPAPKSRRKLRFDSAEHAQGPPVEAEIDDIRPGRPVPGSGQRRVRLDEPHSGEAIGHEFPAAQQSASGSRQESDRPPQEARSAQPPRYQRSDYQHHPPRNHGQGAEENRSYGSSAPQRSPDGQRTYRVSAARPRRPHFADVTEQYSEVHPPHAAMPRPHFDPENLAVSPEAAPTNWLSVVGPVLAYLGVGLLTVGTVLVLWAWFGGPADYAPTGWLITTAGQMLLFLGIVTLVSGGMEQTTAEVRTRIAHLGERILRIEHVSRDHALRGPSIASERFDGAAAHPDDHRMREQTPQSPRR